MITSPDKLQACFQAAQDQRSKLIIVMPQEATSMDSLEASLEDFDENHLYLEISTLENYSNSWHDLEIICYFRLTQKKGPQKEMFFNFGARIVELAKKEKIVKMVLQRPQKLDIGQRRSSMRIEMDQNLMVNFCIWEEHRFIRPRTKDRKTGLYSPRINLDYIQEGSFSVVDLSAGGMKVRATSRLIKELELDWNRGLVLVIWMNLDDPEKAKTQDFWIKGRIRYRTEDFFSKDVDMGVEFTHYGQISPDKKMKWQAVRDHNIEPLGNWTYRRYMENYRKGVATS
ncbi:hypothetical protein [Desulfonatronospira sp. MSAO_Bac3]|uniref:hypothetical protein n=1 Tax=Desulfonatronospira sp. MSAO_Bac3 TaxID=2293857 RepID=UPI000FF4AF4B|nr:hypothetical protein [Desulfonatronospira sp. MSAO_Bac3]RQD73523.1 MAG: hypothetical protein D5S03_12480 [Desulfonatronospira sp. MSAO_Bac3]